MQVARADRARLRRRPRRLLSADGGGARGAGRAVERPVLTGTSADIPALQSAVRGGRGDLRPALAEAYLQRARETGDPVLLRARRGRPARRRARRRPSRRRVSSRSPATTSAARSTLGAPRRRGRRAAIRVDALVELGRYDEAERELQAMIDRKPNLAGYARVSYLRELHGDLDGAVRGDAPGRRRRRPGGGERRLRARAARRAGAPPRHDAARRGARSAQALALRAGPPGRRGRAGAAGRAASDRGRGDQAAARRSSSGCRSPST